jgi:hypothetical protein
MNDDRIPTIGEHRGVGLDDHQSPERLAVVKREIDAVLDGTNEVKQLLVEICADVTWSPEAKLLSAAKCRAMFELAAEGREARQPSTCGLSRRAPARSIANAGAILGLSAPCSTLGASQAWPVPYGARCRWPMTRPPMAARIVPWLPTLLALAFIAAVACGLL